MKKRRPQEAKEKNDERLCQQEHQQEAACHRFAHARHLLCDRCGVHGDDDRRQRPRNVAGLFPRERLPLSFGMHLRAASLCHPLLLLLFRGQGFPRQGAERLPHLSRAHHRGARLLLFRALRLHLSPPRGDARSHRALPLRAQAGDHFEFRLLASDVRHRYLHEQLRFFAQLRLYFAHAHLRMRHVRGVHGCQCQDQVGTHAHGLLPRHPGAFHRAAPRTFRARLHGVRLDPLCRLGGVRDLGMRALGDARPVHPAPV